MPSRMMHLQSQPKPPIGFKNLLKVFFKKVKLVVVLWINLVHQLIIRSI